MSERLDAAIKSIREKTDFVPRVGAVLGSGLGYLADHIEQELAIPYSEIAHFPETSVKGHSGQLVLGHVEGVPVAMLSGRVHMYEGLPASDIVFPIRVLRKLGAEIGFLTNASGGANPDFESGDLMLIEDHINFTGINPLVGPNNDEWGTRFPDMTYPYDPELRALTERTAAELNIPLRKGVYLCVLGPSYETPAEVRMFSKLGADAIGMSTVPEVIAARHMGMRIIAISCIANPAAGLYPGELHHEDVTATVGNKKELFGRLVKRVIAQLKE